jgi:hypothetical protein
MLFKTIFMGVLITRGEAPCKRDLRAAIIEPFDAQAVVVPGLTQEQP